MKLKYQWPLVWQLVLWLPFCDYFSLPAINGTLWQHLLWPLAHANIVHWFLNTISFMALWRMVTIPRILCGYAASVVIGYLWCWYSSFFILHSSLKLVGFSSIIFFLLGIIFARARNRYRLRLAILIAISCFVPGMAASVHILALLSGIIYYYGERWFSRRSSSGYIFYSVAAGLVYSSLFISSLW